jgi:hypothetical protein
MYYDNQNKLYRPSAVASALPNTAPTKFKQIVTIDPIGDDEAAVTVTIKWKGQGFGQPERSFTIRTNIFKILL